MCFWSRKPAPPPRSPYVYSEALSEGCIRLLEYRGESLQGFFSFLQQQKSIYKIVTVELSRAPHYTAVSYMWGEAERSSKILIGNSHTLNITASAKECLDVLSSQYLWIDSICINQDDNKEKSDQVKLMGEIYHHASRVVGVLGRATRLPGLESQIHWASSLASATLDHLGLISDNIMRDPWDSWPGALNDERRSTFLDLMDYWDSVTGAFDDDRRRERSSVLDFTFQTGMTEEDFRRSGGIYWRLQKKNLDGHTRVLKSLCHPYWRRVWIIQELAFAKNLTIYFNGEFFSWRQLMDMFADQYEKEEIFLSVEKRLYFETISYGKVRDAYLRGSRLLRMIDQTRRIKKRTLKDVLVDTIGSLATEPRDKIFGILNLVSDEPITEADANEVAAKAELVKLDPWFGNPSIFPDYGKPCQQVLTETTLAMIMAGDVNTHLLAGGIGWNYEDRNMPSWVIDWSHLPKIYSNISSNTRLDMLGKRVWTGSTAIDVGDSAFMPRDRKRIMGKSMTRDKIVFLSPWVKADGPEWFHGCWEALCEVLPEQYAWKDSVFFPSITRLEALWRVLLDVGETGRPKTHRCVKRNTRTGLRS
ncbi:heterokaryon incompatibility protein-domain-containing protein [Hypoxylon rubiginosum]|uniref:Heterokaryon incompatibility protein-domain-containing protein n=1 Tax=Hypoxylon rubiginosum TaxID=110542 RepID=A0ACB9Z631_9PEZI|nr:heterokaryon incompatibility protein-domain-containing protein [Hypoxylon rubiginosum]